MEPLVGIVMVNWNRADDTLACLESIRRMDYRNLHVTLIDNGSTDASPEVLGRIPDIDFVPAGENLGIARANNIGIRRALDAGAAYILLLNNDTVVQREMLTRLVRACRRDPRVGIVGPAMYYYDQPTTLWFAGGRILRWRGDTAHVGMHEPDHGQYAGTRETDYITSCALLARREVFDEVGLIDPAYFIYFDETDLCVRARRAGWKILFVPEARLWHRISSTMGSGSARYWHHYTRSRLIFIRKHASPAEKASALAYVALVDTPRLLAHFLRRRKTDCIGPFLRGIGQGLTARLEPAAPAAPAALEDSWPRS